MVAINKTTDKFQDECAVVGAIGVPEASKYCYLGLYSMQHRGQEGAGIVSTDRQSKYSHKDTGLVADVFDEDSLAGLQGAAAIGHNRYATFGRKDKSNLQPLTANFLDYNVSVAHNGNLVNAKDVRKKLEAEGAIFSTTSDTECFLHLIAKANSKKSMADRIKYAMSEVQGAYSVVVLTKEFLYAVRDPTGVRPLSLAKIGDGFVVASETCAFDLIGAEYVRDIEPGEVLEIDIKGKMQSFDMSGKTNPSFCVFEYVYFSRPDSNIAGKNVYQVRKQLGGELAKESPVEADYVIPVPDSGVPAALGYSHESKIPLEFGLIRNHYVGRTFIEPEQSIRDFGVKIKLNPNASLIKGKDVILVDDSLVRGTTSKKIVAMLRQAGVAKVHFRISSPPTTGPCHYGIDTPSKSELIAAKQSVEEIKEYIGADSLSYLSNEGMFRAANDKRESYCDACFSGDYPCGVPS